MAADVKEVHLQDLASVLATSYEPTDIDTVFRRFEVEPGVFSPEADSILDGLRGLADTDEFRPVLANLIENGSWTETQVRDLEEALEGSPLSVLETDSGLELYQRIRATADRTIEDKRGALEEMAPTVVWTQIEAAESAFGSGEYDLAAAEIRRAMDMLVVGRFEEGLEELAEQDLISLGDEHEHSDATLLYVAYGYCSFLGANPEAKGFETSKLQGSLALTLGQEVLYFLLEMMDAAEEAGIDLRYWERP